MTGGPLLVAIATSGRIAQWQVSCIEELAAVPGVSIVRWLRSSDGDDRNASRAEASAIPATLLAIATDDEKGPDPALDGSPDTAVDLVVDLTERGIGSPAPWAREIWRFGFGRVLARDLMRIVLEDYVRGPGITRVALVRHPDDTVIQEGWLRSMSWWHRAELERVLATPAGWVAAAVRTIVADAGHGEPTSGARGASSAVLAAEIRHDKRSPALPSTLLKVAAVGRRVADVADGFVRHSDWSVGVIDTPIESMLDASGEGGVTWLPGRRGHFAADPFGLERDGVLHVFYEDFDQRRALGSIHHVSMAPDGTLSSPEQVLAPGFHTSYPFLVEDRGAVFMLPEASSSGELVLYEATSFPRDWRPVATLLPGIPAIDASVVRFEERWWMFACRLDRGENHDLFIWYASDLSGPWTPHALNPVKSDARSSRPGGTPFVSDGILYRPGQDDSTRYGRRLVINRVDTLSPTAFAERPVRIVEPRTDFPDGLHTLSRAGRRTLIDGNRRHFVPDAFRSRIGR